MIVVAHNAHTMYITSRAHEERQQMDRRRFEAAHMKYACLCMAAQYPEAKIRVTVESCVMDTLHKITPALFCSFEAKYAGICIVAFGQCVNSCACL